MKKIMLQAGHAGVTTGATGAPGEQELNKRIRNRLSEILISKGFQLYLVDANPPASQLNQDFDLFLALHGDANVYGTGGGFIDHPRPDTDAATVESQRIDAAIESEYFTRTGIVNHPERSNANTTLYYMWSQLSAKTPCVIMEMGVVQDAHDKVILADTDRVASAIARGICKAFNVQYDAPTPPPASVPDAKDKQIADLTKQLADQKVATSNAVKLGVDQLAQQKKDFQAKLDEMKKDLQAIVQKCTI